MAAATLQSPPPFSTITRTTTSLTSHTQFSFFPKYPFPLLTKPLSLSSHITLCTKRDDIDINFFTSDEFESDDPLAYDAPEKPYGFVPFRAVDEEPFESEEDEIRAFKELYGTAYSGEFILGKKVPVTGSKSKKSSASGLRARKERIRDGFEETIVQVRRVTKVVKGGKQLKFRVIVVVGNKKGQVGVGCAQAKEISSAAQKAAADARRKIVNVPMTKYLTFPHRAEANYGAAKVMLRPAAPGTGIIAGGAVRIVLEMAGLQNALGKQLRSNNALNNARATIVAVESMRQFSEVALQRGIPMEELWK